MTHRPPGIYYDMSVEEYRAHPALNQSTLKAFGKSPTPAHFQYELKQPKTETPALRIGNYVDSAIFRPEELGTKYSVWKERRQGKDWETFKEGSKNRTILNGDEIDTAEGCVTSLKKHEDTKRILSVCRTQAVVIAEHPDLGCQVKGAIDLLPDQSKCHHSLSKMAFDLKTTADASNAGFSDQCWRMGYDIQAAFYMDLLMYSGVTVDTFGFIAVETYGIHAVNIMFIDRWSEEDRRGRGIYLSLATRYLECVKSGKWTDYGSEWKRVKYKPWQLRDEPERETLE